MVALLAFGLLVFRPKKKEDKPLPRLQKAAKQWARYTEKEIKVKKIAVSEATRKTLDEKLKRPVLQGTHSKSEVSIFIDEGKHLTDEQWDELEKVISKKEEN